MAFHNLQSHPACQYISTCVLIRHTFYDSLVKIYVVIVQFLRPTVTPKTKNRVVAQKSFTRLTIFVFGGLLDGTYCGSSKIWNCVLTLTFQANLCSHYFWDVRKEGPEPKWTTNSTNQTKIIEEMSVCQ